MNARHGLVCLMRRCQWPVIGTWPYRYSGISATTKAITTPANTADVHDTPTIPAASDPTTASTSTNSKTKYLIPSSLLDSYSIITNMKNSGGLTEVQAIALMQTFKEIINTKFRDVEKNLVSQLQVDIDSSMLKSRIHEIRLELHTLSNKNAIEAKTLHEKAIGEIQTLFEKLRDAADILQIDAKMRLHFYKAENREELQKVDSIYHQGNGHLTVTMSDVKTNVETVKLKAIYSFTVVLMIMFVLIILERSVAKEREKKKQIELQKKEEEQILQ